MTKADEPLIVSQMAREAAEAVGDALKEQFAANPGKICVGIKIDPEKGLLAQSFARFERAIRAEIAGKVEALRDSRRYGLISKAALTAALSSIREKGL